ncbi:MAG: cell division protein FtsW [Lachnospiraceae bacterium]|nr:cell division protein FtsW [Lachnospiraceae bacterium]
MKKQREQKYNSKKALLRTKIDLHFLLAVLFINVFGLIMIYSASYYYAESAYHMASDYFFKNQLTYVLIGFAAMILVSFFRPTVYQKFIFFSLVVMFFFLVAVRIPGIGHESHGAYRWIGYKTFLVQIAEPVKICMIIFVAGMIVKTDLSKTRTMIMMIAIGIVVALLLLILSNNMSTAIIVFLMMYFTLMIAHPKPKWMIIIAVGAVILAVIAVAILVSTEYDPSENFRITRIRAWIYPTDPEFVADTAYQPTQALYAIASGGFFGKGLGQSLIKFKLPEPHNDYILAIIFEELGIFGVIILTYLYGYLLYKIYKVFSECRDRFTKYLVIGVFFHLAIQVLLNYAVTLGLFPTMGVTLPFVSAGGSSATFTLLELGVVMAAARQNEENRIYEEAFEDQQMEDPYYRQLIEEKKKRKQAETPTS